MHGNKSCTIKIGRLTWSRSYCENMSGPTTANFVDFLSGTSLHHYSFVKSRREKSMRLEATPCTFWKKGKKSRSSALVDMFAKWLAFWNSWGMSRSRTLRSTSTTTCIASALKIFRQCRPTGQTKSSASLGILSSPWLLNHQCQSLWSRGLKCGITSAWVCVSPSTRTAG